ARRTRESRNPTAVLPAREQRRREVRPRQHPLLLEPKPRERPHLHEPLGRVLVRALGPDRLPFNKANLELSRGDVNRLSPLAHEVHLDAPRIFVPSRAMIEPAEVEVAAE